MNWRDRRPRMIMQGHADGELWGLATHPTKPMFITASDDGSIRTWNMKTCDLIQMATLDSPARSAAFSASTCLFKYLPFKNLPFKYLPFKNLPFKNLPFPSRFMLRVPS